MYSVHFEYDFGLSFYRFNNGHGQQNENALNDKRNEKKRIIGECKT